MSRKGAALPLGPEGPSFRAVNRMKFLFLFAMPIGLISCSHPTEREPYDVETQQQLEEGNRAQKMSLYHF